MSDRIRLQPLVDVYNSQIVGYEVFIKQFDDASASLNRSVALYPSATTALNAVISGCPCSRFENFQLFINLTADDAVSKTFCDDFVHSLREFCIDGSCIVLELNENTNHKMLPLVKSNLNLLRAHGIKIALDDFGIGCSTIEFLSELPVDIVKIDKKFVQGAPNNKKSMSLLKFCVDVSHDIGCQVVAEGIETKEQLECARGAGADIAQGFLFSAPLNSNILKIKSTPFIDLADFSECVTFRAAQQTATVAICG